MAQAVLSAPLTLDPQTCTKLVLKKTIIEHDAKAVQLHFDLVGADGKVLASRSLTATGAQVTTWINNQEAILVNRLLAVLGLTGTVS
jgi:hypothetical protein